MMLTCHFPLEQSRGTQRDLFPSVTSSHPDNRQVWYHWLRSAAMFPDGHSFPLFPSVSVRTLVGLLHLSLQDAGISLLLLGSAGAP